MKQNDLIKEAVRFSEGMKKLGYSPQDIIDITGASLSTVRRWKVGELSIPDPELILLLISTGLSIDYVRTGEGGHEASEEEFLRVFQRLLQLGFDKSLLLSNLQLNRIDHKANLMEFADQELIIQVANSLINNPESKILRSLFSIVSLLPAKDQKALLKEAIRIEDELFEKLKKSK
ncbi:hypothetical protein EHQ52_14780 [Leptospira koniambonensis]|uniref:Uncharacterized protein n=1 Tax=Leptospira koniambonensis TaxID=2484950 RepID=A0A4R9J6G2_9LEPT|nr:hypothetical protein [Leptospira koniambonensis]TGL32548.1 hypothetical protein EHQ52_14780 [Leptospira koniambonensis]